MSNMFHILVHSLSTVGHICCQRGDLDRWINVPLESLKLFLQCCTCLYNSSHLGTGLIQVMGHGMFMMPKRQRNEVI